MKLNFLFDKKLELVFAVGSFFLNKNYTVDNGVTNELENARRQGLLTFKSYIFFFFNNFITH